MSLNGLDSPEVQAAYNTAVAEAAGWFLLKYKTRDAVDLLAHGRGGVSEARTAISAYTDKSPLYGLLMYRRRRILVKYIPEGTSRLLQARTNVHLQDVLEKYSPYETLLEIPTADALSDTSLAQSFPLHTASASPAPSGGRLDEIHEDEDEEGREGQKESRSETPSSGRLLSPQRTRPGRRSDNLSARAERAERLASSLHAGRVSTPTSMNPLAPPLGQSTTQSATKPLDADGENKLSQETGTLTANADISASKEIPAALAPDSVPAALAPADSVPPTPPPKDDASVTPLHIEESRPVANTAPQKEADETVRARDDDAVRQSTDRSNYSDRTSSIATLSRPFSTDEDPYDLSKYDELFKPKVKLGPRPVSTMEKTKRAARVSAVPASFKSALRKSDSERPTSQASMTHPPRTTSMAPPPRTATASSAPTLSTLVAPPIPATPDSNPRPTSRSSVKSAASHRSIGMTTDKLRLMKALDFRKRQMRKSQQSTNDTEPVIDAEAPMVPQMPATAIERTVSAPPAGGSSYQETAEELRRDPTANHNHTLSSKADSGIEMRYDSAEDARGEVERIAEDEYESVSRDEKTPEPRPEQHSDQEEDQKSQADSPAKQEKPIEAAAITTAGAENPVKETLDSSSTLCDPEESVMEKSWLNISGENIEADRRIDSGGENVEADRRTDSVDDTVPDAANQTANAPPDASGGSEENRVSIPAITMEAASRPATANDASNVESAPTASIRSSVSSMTDDGKLSRPNSVEVAKRRRRGVVEPLITSGDSTPRDDFMSDDEFLEELHSATIVEARPVTVARSPITPLNGAFNFSNQTNIDDSHSVRSVSIYRSSSYRNMGDEGDQLSADRDRSMSVRSRASPTPPPEKNELAAQLTRNVSSGISRRIQALNQYNSREPSPGYTAQARPLTPETSPNAFLHQDSKDRKLPGKTLAKRRLSRNTGSHTSQSPVEGTPVWSVQHDPATNSKSVSVSARIVRPQQEPDESSQLQQSDLSFAPRDSASHQSLPDLPRPINTNIAPSATSTPPLSPAATSHSGEYRTLHSTNGRFNRRKKAASAEDAGAVGRHSWKSSSVSANEENAAPSIKGGSRASRFFKRVSTLGGPKRKSVAPSITSSGSGSGQGTISESIVADKSDTPPAVVVGDLNVQFPDSLLWKRRIVSIDDLGALAFSPTQGSTRAQSLSSPLDTPVTIPGGGISAKRFPLAEFKSPTTPDLERQELPHSVVLEFPDGTTLQLACEDAMTQRQVLHLLRSYWRSWTAVAAA